MFFLFSKNKTLSHIFTTSLLCEIIMITMDPNSFFIDLINSISEFSSNPEVGSSNIRTLGSEYKALANASFCLSPLKTSSLYRKFFH